MWVLGTVFMMSAAAQDRGSTALTIQDVKVGMTRNVVLAGLARSYEVRRMDPDEPDIAGRWFFYGKDPNNFQQAEIWFWQDKVYGIYVDLYPPMKGEAVKLVERLFFLLRDKAPIDPGVQNLLKNNPPDSVVRSIANHSHLDLPVDVYYKRSDKLESMEIDFSIGKEHFSIEASKLEGFPDTVEIKQNTDLLIDRQN
jgi:hypothetical protein